jgi:predicted negative regulator of RcsB-dependent stress response
MKQINILMNLKNWKRINMEIIAFLGILATFLLVGYMAYMISKPHRRELSIDS